ncbi:chromosome partitioning protein [Gammaproteobacteria bacterium]
MEKLYWTSSDIQKLFLLVKRNKSRQTLLNAEERGEIPKAERIPRGSIQVRQWKLNQLPAIGTRYGFLSKPETQLVICIYTPKGGVLKTTFAYNLGRILALNGIKTLFIGLDIQCSLTDYALPPKQFESLEESEESQLQRLGLYHLLFEKAPLTDVIKTTSLPTLDVIPETPDLNILEKKLRLESRREYLFKDRLIKYLGEYDVIIFDNGPSWNQLIENALTASKSIITPIGCDIETYQALQTNLGIVSEFQQTMNLVWDNFYLIPTLLEKTKLSQQIYGAYLNKYGDKVISIPIRRSVIGQESRVLRHSVMEHDPTSPLAQDYFDLISDLWKKLLKKDK